MHNILEAIEHILPEQFTYTLPDHRIASFPLENRDHSKLLVRSRDGAIVQDVFQNMAVYLDAGSHVIFNNSRVIPARLRFTRDTGSRIEFFCLRPADPVDYNQSLAATRSCIWECMIGNRKRFKGNTLQTNVVVQGVTLLLKAEIMSQRGMIAHIRFSWNHAGISFGAILGEIGRTPLPPYIKREDIELDRIRYQTVYSKLDGSVAAPTAGLHFTPAVFDQLARRNIGCHELTLHVGAGTFQPMKSSRLKDHDMHAEVFTAPAELINKLAGMQKRVTCVGTTSLRALESLYWLGVRLLESGNMTPEDLQLEQWEAYHLPRHVAFQKSFETLGKWMHQQGIRELPASTKMMIVPGYDFQVTDTLITNFHQPRSTLLLLVAAFTGESWQEVYQYALQHDFRFLSYGDSSLLFR